ncbi:MAG: mucoidy inhibitor MuiA family protein [Stomatobaculum sp.]|nr:mucoidy inhibitor MuiA family protein [Stomatobaculum sp.]
MTKLSTEIVKAGVFRNGAEIIRRGTAELTAGPQTLYAYGLTRTALQDTARLLCGGNLTCSEVRFVTVLEDEVEEEQAAAEGRIAELQKEIEVREYQEELWKTNGNFSSRASGQPAEIEEYIEKLPERIGKLQEEIRKFRKEIQKLEERKQELVTEQNRLVMAMEVTAEQAGPVPFELRYFENAAGWSSVNEIHSDAEKAPEIRMRAKITQKTDEDWKNVEISLFTGSPSSGERLPELRPRFLEIKEPVTVQPMSQAFMGMGMAMAQGSMNAAAGAMQAQPIQRMETKAAEIRSEETMTEYILPGTMDILHGSQGTMADLQKVPIPAEYQVITAAPEDPHAYLTAVVKTADLPFAEPVSAAVYLKGMFNGRTELDPRSDAEQTEITLGREERIQISRKEISRKTSTTLLKGQKVTEYVYETRIANISDRDITLTLRDQVPVSRDKEITVELKEISGAALEQETGFLTKKITLLAGRAVTVPLSYKVSRPKDKEIREVHTKVSASGRFCYTCGSKITGSPRFCPTCGATL